MQSNLTRFFAPPTTESEHHVCKLTDSKMGVDAGVASRAGEVLVLPVGDVCVGARVSVLFGQTEIDEVHHVATSAQTHQEVVRLDVSAAGREQQKHELGAVAFKARHSANDWHRRFVQFEANSTVLQGLLAQLKSSSRSALCGGGLSHTSKVSRLESGQPAWPKNTLLPLRYHLLVLW